MLPNPASRFNSSIAHFSENRKSGRKKRKIKNKVENLVANEKNFISKKISADIQLMRDSYETGGRMFSQTLDR